MTLLISSAILIASSFFGPLLQNNERHFHHLTVDDGLPQSSVFAITEDSFGFLWFGTQVGLSRYNGHRFDNINRIRVDDRYENLGRITKILSADDGNLWLVSGNYGLVFYDAAKEQIIPFGGEKYLSRVSAIKKDNRGALYWGTKSGLVGKISPDLQEISQIGKINEAGHLIKDLEIDASGSLWVGTVGGLYHWKEGSGFQSLNEIVDNVPGSLNVWTVMADMNDLWVGTLQGLFRLEGILSGEYNLKIFLSSKGKTGTLPHNLVRAIAKDPTGKIWVGTGNGLAWLENGVFRRMERDNLRPNGLNDRYFYSVYFDRNGNLWAGSFFGGINVSYNGLNGYKHIFENFKEEGLKGKVVKCFLENGDELWIGTEDGGISIWNRKSGDWRYLNATNGLNNNNIQSLLKDGKGRIWIGLFRGGVTRIDTNGEKREFLKITGSINSNVISFIKEDKDGRIWLGTFNRGLSYFDEVSRSFVPFTESRGGNAIDLTSYQGGVVWAENSELIYLRKDQDQAKLINFDNDKNININAILARNGTLWLATVSQGLIIGRIEDGVFSIQQQFFPFAMINSIVPDEYGEIWVTSHQSLYQFDVTGKLLQSFNQAQGIKSYFNRTASYALSSGEILFGGISGFCIIDPEKIKTQRYAPKMMINELYVNFKKVSAESNPDILAHPLPKVGAISLSSNQDNISLEFINLHFTEHPSEEYFYRLVGLSDEWVSNGSQRKVVFNNLSSGDYTFEVTTKEPYFSGSNRQKASLSIHIAPPWWNTIWAYAIYLTCFIGFLYLFRKYSVIRVEKRNILQMEQLERDKQKEVYESKIKFFTNISHELRTPLTLIIGPLEEYMHHVKIQEEKLALTIIRKNAYRLFHLVNQILDFRKYDNKAMVLESGTINLLDVLEGVKESFLSTFRLKQIKCEIDTGLENCFINVDRLKMEQVFYNLFSNALKHTPQGGEIKVNLFYERLTNNKIIRKKSENRLIILVSDTGFGMEPHTKKEIFTPFYSEPNRKGGVNSGIGLALVKEIVELHKGTITVESEPEKGTAFKISLPVQKNNDISHPISDEVLATMETTNLLTERAVNPALLLELEEENTFAPEDNEEQVSDKPQILIVDDEKDVRNFITTCLAKDYEVVTASNGVEGLTKAKQIAPELIISDIGMPEMDGISLCRELRGHFATNNIPIILLTVHKAVENQLEGAETGADLYLTKPFNAELLREWVRNLLTNRQKLTESIRKELLMEPEVPAPVSEKEEFLVEARKIIEKHMTDSMFGVENMAEEMGISRTVLYRKFKQITEMSPKDFIRQSRLKRAAQLISGGNMTIAEVTYAVGYNDLRYFRESFQKKFGVIPSEYK